MKIIESTISLSSSGSSIQATRHARVLTTQSGEPPRCEAPCSGHWFAMLPCLRRAFIGVLACASPLVVAQGAKVASVQTTSLGTDPEGSARLNGMSFQQDAITSFNGWQYV